MQFDGKFRLLFDSRNSLGHFISGVTGSPEAIAAVKKKSVLPIELHLMVRRPEETYKKFREVGVDIFIVHVESTAHISRVLTDIKTDGARAALSLNPGTPFEAVRDVLHLADK